MSLPTDYQQYISLRYARWIPELNRRETWPETVSRFVKFMNDQISEKHGYIIPKPTLTEIYESILNLHVMPSMRALMTAGDALARDNCAGYNCAYVAIDKIERFDEILYILMCGTGVGFSVERQEISKLPTIPDKLDHLPNPLIVRDSRIGWAEALRSTIRNLYNGHIQHWDLSRIRKQGERLNTFGGHASGPEPFDKLLKFIVQIFQKATGRKLTSIEVHDIVCKIAEIVVVGGVRRSALISLSNLSDDRMRHAKSGQWWLTEPQRALANNSVSYTEKPDAGRFLQEWLSLYESKSGERGIFNREACRQHITTNTPWRDLNHEFGCNPCSEIILRPAEFCNLTEVVIRATDAAESIRNKVKIATLIGTIQSTLTDFRYLGDEYKQNCEDERLLGVSLTGIMDNVFMSGRPVGGSPCNPQTRKRKHNHSDFPESLPEFLTELKLLARSTNRHWAHKFNIRESAAITTVKPSGTVSQLVNSSSGIHSRHSKYYIRTVRGDHGPVSKFLQSTGVPWEPCAMQPDNTIVFSFPVKSPDECITRDDMTALEQLEICLIYNKYWCEHKVSVTITVREHEWVSVGAWIYEHFNETSGISFLPHSEHTYQQAPYQECSEQEYLALLEKMPKKIDWSKLSTFERTDTTSPNQEFACTSGACEYV